MYTLEEQRLASKLYSMLYKGANIYNAPNRAKPWGLQDPMARFALIIRELKQHMKEIENG
jgi:hypothetical protein